MIRVGMWGVNCGWGRLFDGYYESTEKSSTFAHQGTNPVEMKNRCS